MMSPLILLHYLVIPFLLPAVDSNSGCNQICMEPLASVPGLTPCRCVLPIKVRILLHVSLHAICPDLNYLALEIAVGTFLDQNQVSVVGATADAHNSERTLVDINLIPREEKFDNTTALLTYQKLLQKKVPLNRSLFGDYEVICISYPGLPLPSSGPPFCGGPTRHQFPMTSDFRDRIRKMSIGVIVVISSSALVLLVLVVCGAIIVPLKCRKAGRASTTDDDSTMPVSLVSVKTFSVADLNQATHNFSSERILGGEGFECVYHGVLGDGTEIAVKLLTQDNQNGDNKLISEVEMLSRLNHVNLVKLVGICFEQHIRCLVYEYVPNGSVESHLHGVDKSKEPLDWDARLKIALGAARGLAYLHEDSNRHVIHRDFKTSHVLLEDDLTPKVLHFGLAEEATGGSHHISNHTMGTFRYIAPEYAMAAHLLVKSDVFSYGVFLLELLSGRKPIDMSQPPGQDDLVNFARPLLTCKEGLEQIVDPLLDGRYDFDDVVKVASIASMCIHPEVARRPFMGEVVQAFKLISNDKDITCDTFTYKDSSAGNSDSEGELIPSVSSWSNAGSVKTLPTHDHTFILTEDYCSAPVNEFKTRRFKSLSFYM